MPSYLVETPQRSYWVIVKRGISEQVAGHFPAGAGKVFVVTTADVWGLCGSRIARFPHQVLFYPGGEERKRLAAVEALAEEMVERGGDRASLVVAFGGGIVSDVGGFLAAIFMRGIPVLQVPTTLLAQVDAGIGGKTGVNLASGKNLVGSFHQPLAVLIDPDLLATLPERQYRAGLFEVIKCGVIRSPDLFALMRERREQVLARSPEIVEAMIAESVRIKAEVVTADEREGDLRRILNFGHTVGHALEAQTDYARFLHGEAVAFGMRVAVYLAEVTGRLSAEDSVDILNTIDSYGPIPSLKGITAEALLARLRSDKKTVKGQVHFVLPERIGEVVIVGDLEEKVMRSAVQDALG